MYQLFNNYLEAHKKGSVNRSYYREKLQKMGKNKDTIHVLLDQFEFDAKLLSSYPKQKKKAKRLFFTSLVFSLLLVSLLLFNTRFSIVNNHSQMTSTFVLAIPIYAITRAIFSLSTIKKSTNRILHKWKNF